MTDTKYPINIFWSEEDESFIATTSDLPDCFGIGATQHEAESDLQRAIVAWIEAATAAGDPIPEPSKSAWSLLASKIGT